MSIEAQAELAVSFVDGVIRCFGVDANVASTVDDGTIEVTVSGSRLGLLVGPRGATLEALQELTRTAVQRHSDEHTGRIHVDVAGYRARRAAALQEFAQRVAQEVVESGQPSRLEPMSAADRKVVHDAVTDIAGVATSSEGEDPRRYVVVRPVVAAPEFEDDEELEADLDAEADDQDADEDQDGAQGQDAAVGQDADGFGEEDGSDEEAEAAGSDASEATS